MSLPALNLSLKRLTLVAVGVGADDPSPTQPTQPKKQKRRITLTPREATAAGPSTGCSYADAARSVLSCYDANPDTFVRHHIWSRPVRDEEQGANQQLAIAFSTGIKDAPSLDDLVKIAQTCFASVEAPIEILKRSDLSPAKRSYILDVVSRSGPGKANSRIDFAMDKRWRQAFEQDGHTGKQLQNVPSFKAYVQMNEELYKRMEQINIMYKRMEQVNISGGADKEVSSVEHVMVALPGGTDQDLHTDGGDQPLCVVALNLRQPRDLGGHTEFPNVCTSYQTMPTSVTDHSRLLVAFEGDSSGSSGPSGCLYRVNDTTGSVSAWSGKAPHRGTANGSCDARVFLYTEWALGEHN